MTPLDRFDRGFAEEAILPSYDLNRRAPVKAVFSISLMGGCGECSNPPLEAERE